MKNLTIREATALAVDKMVRAGIAPEEAAIAAPIYIEGELCGRPSHGLRHLYNNLIQYELGAAERTPLAVLNETPVSALVDGGFHHAYYVNERAMQLVIDKAAITGLAITTSRKAGGSGILSYYTRKIAEAGFIGIALAGAPAVVVPFGGQEPLLGTNPLSVGIPRRNAPPILLDMATSAGTFNQILMAKTTGEPLPEGIALGPDGQPTTDPFAAQNEDGRPRLLPLAGYKGFGLALVIQLLTAAGAGGPLGRQSGIVHNPHFFHSLFMAYRPDLFVSLDEFEAGVEGFLTDLAEIERSPGTDRIRLPGDETNRKRQEALDRGVIEIEEATYDFLLS